MYLNVNLTPPDGGSAAGGGESSCANTPKTPEILNSLISLTAQPASSYTSFHCQSHSGDLLSPASSSASPSEETSSTHFGTPTPTACGGSQISPSGSDPGGGPCIFTRVSGVFKGVPASIAGTPSPPVPELPSPPVNTVEATKSALIKEGLKIQIKSKLQAAGLEPSELLADKKSVKEEVSDSQELTPQDEERRLRRRERNKIAATKCRNKKKEKTVILMSESETVEDQNHRLKNEIQRLTSEKMKLEKLLDDPGHVASCRHSCGRASHSSQPPLIVINTPDASEQLLSSPTDGLIPSVAVSSEQSPDDVVSNLPPSFCSPNVSTLETSFTSDSSSPSYVNLSPSTISPLRLPSVSPPGLTSPSTHFPPESSPLTMTYLSPSSSGQCTNYAEEATLLSLATTSDSTTNQILSHIHPSTEPHAGPSSKPVGTSSTSTFLTPKSSKPQRAAKRQQPYDIARPQKAHMCSMSPSVTPQTHDMTGYREYPYSLSKEETLLNRNPFIYPTQPSHVSCLEYSSDTCCDLPKHDQIVGKVRSQPSHQSRYSPYDRSNRQHQTTEPLQPNICSSTFTVNTSSQNTINEDNYLTTSCNPFLSEIPSNQFYSSCSYENI